MANRPDFSQMKNMSEVQLHNMRTFGDYTQFIYADKPYSSKTISTIAISVAKFLKHQNVKHLSKVAICSKLCPEAFAVFPGVWFVGATLCPINHKLSGSQIREILEMTNSEVLFITAEVWDRVKADLGNIPGLKKVVTLQGKRDDTVELESLILKDATLDFTSPSQPDDPALILFSSGSTGKPKGIIQTQKNLVCEIEKFRKMHEEFGDPDFLSPQAKAIRVLFNTPLGHTAGTVGLTLNIANGSTFILQDVLELEDMLGLIQRHKIQAYFYGPPTVYAAMLEYPHLSKFDISSMRYWATGAAPISHERVLLLKKMLPGKFGIMYGLTETACVATAVLCDDTYVPNSVGKPLPGVKIEIRDSTGQVLPHGQIGEVCIHGDNVSPGYLNLEDETKKSFQNGWLYSGDLGYVDDQKNLFLSGRSKLMIIQGGVKIFPRTIETVLEAVPEIKECAVVGMADEILGERVVAFVSFKKDKSLSSAELKDICAKQLARYEVPRQFVFLEALPRTPTNKIDITLLRQGSMGKEPAIPQANKASQIQKREELTAKLIDIARRLKVENLSPDAPLMQSGFDSLAAVEFAIAVQDLLARPVPETLIFNFPTLNEVVDHLLKDESDRNESSEAGHASVRRDLNDLSHDIAIVGTACRLPGQIYNTEDLWKRLTDKIDCIGAVPEDRWESDKYFDPRPFVEGKIGQAKGGFIDAFRFHDPKFFDLSLNEAKTMDPQQRIVHQMAWEAIENAGLDPRELEKISTGVMIGISSYDFCALAYQSGKFRPDYTVGYMPPFVAGRLAHWLNLSGPTFVLDTACSSSLVALHLACQSLRAGDSDAVIVGGLGMMLTPTNSQSLSMMGILAPDSACKTFDASANGTVRSEGGAVIIVKRLSDAERDGNRILGIIKGSAVNHDAKSANVGAPSGKAQVKVIKSALRSAGVTPDQVNYVEAHGTGTALGDAIELYSINEAYQADQRRPAPLHIGSVKANLGHTEGGAGISGLLKILSAFKHGEIPPQINFKNPNPKFDWSKSALKVPLVPTKWPVEEPIASVSSFGITGTNAHVVLQKYKDKNPSREIPTSNLLTERTHHILCLSAKSPKSLRSIAGKYLRHLENDTQIDLPSFCHTANVYRSHFQFRQALVFKDRQELLNQLRALAEGTSNLLASGRSAKIGFCFTGQGGAAAGMGLGLLNSNAKFRDSIQLTDKRIKDLLNMDYRQLVADDERLLKVRHTQSAVSSLQLALVEMLKDWGLSPTHVVGHSGGEFVAAATAGILAKDDALMLASKRALMIEKLTLNASMATSFGSLEAVSKIIEDKKLNIEVAATNAPQLVTIVGDRDEVAKAIDVLNELGIKTRALKGTSEGVGFHSRQVEPILNELQKLSEQVQHSAPQVQYFSSHLGRRLASSEKISGSYWSGLTRKPVFYDKALKAMIEDGVELFIEIGPHNTLIAMGPMNVPATHQGKVIWKNALSNSEDNWKSILGLLKSSYEKGFSIDWKAFDRDFARQVLEIPTYAFEYVDLGLHPYGSNSGSRPQAQALAEAEQRRTDYSKKEIGDWLRGHLSSAFGIDAAAITSQTRAFELGIDSVKSIEFILDVEGQFGARLEVTELMANPTFDSICDLISAKLTDSSGTAGQQEVQQSAWISNYVQSTESRHQLFCFHHLGGGASLFQKWPQLLGKNFDVVPVQLPGREERFAEAPYNSFPELAQDLAAFLPSVINSKKGFSFYGHSMGGGLAIAIAEILKKEHGLVCENIFISGIRGPTQWAKDTHWNELITEKNISDFIEIPEKLKKSGEFLKAIVERVQSDLRVVRSMSEYFEPQVKIPFKLTALAGNEDPIAPAETVKAWEQNCKTGHFEFKSFPGGHMFINSNLDSVVELVAAKIKLS